MRGKWTAGPWFMSGVRQKVGGADTHSVVATVDGKEIIIASVWYNPITHEGFHDTRLIAASPSLADSAAEIDRLMLVIESAVRFADPAYGPEVLAALKANRAALSLAHPPKGEEPANHPSEDSTR